MDHGLLMALIGRTLGMSTVLALVGWSGKGYVVDLVMCRVSILLARNDSSGDSLTIFKNLEHKVFEAIFKNLEHKVIRSNHRHVD